MDVKRYNPSYTEGLTREQVIERINSNLINYDNQPPTKTVKQIIKDNFFTYFNFLNVFLGLSILLAGLFGGKFFYALKNCLFMGVIIANSIISIIQEVMSKKIIDKLSVISQAKVEAIRDSKVVELAIDEIVLDDILKFKIGNQVVTDAIIEEGVVEVNEAFITGEAEPLVKKKGDMLLSGSFIISGSCYAKVEHIGEDNYISTISSEAKYQKKVNSVIMNSFEKMLKILSIVIIPLGIVLFINQLSISNYNISDSIISTVAALIGMIPEGLVLLTSSVMAVSVIRLSRYKVLVQQLYCIETLARVDVICLDKTGTITEGKMEVADVVSIKDIDNMDVILASLARGFDNSNATTDAIADKYNSDKLLKVRDKVEFSSIRKFSGIEFDKEGTFYIGAPEFLLKSEVKKYKKDIEKYQNDYRVLVLARSSDKVSSEPSNLEVIAFILIQDKIRKEAFDTLDYFQKQGVSVKIISGDNHLTVASIAKRAGLGEVTAIDATTITDDNIDEVVSSYNVFGRVTPAQKKMIIKALQKQGHTVAMTGDGVNDVLALKASDCSIAMASGSEAARNVSQLVLLNSDFSAMPKVVAEGRRTINNIERSASLLLVKTIFTLFLIFICIFMESKYFYIPIQLTLITMFTISVPSFILALEPNTELVKGNFLLKVISKSLPAALTVVFNVLVLALFQREFGLDEDLISSLVVLLTATTGFLFLFRICKPFNLLRIIMFMVLLSGFTYGYMFHYEFFDFAAFSFQTVLVFTVLFICSLYIFERLNKIVKFVLDKVEAKYYKV